MVRRHGSAIAGRGHGSKMEQTVRQGFSRRETPGRMEDEMKAGFLLPILALGSISLGAFEVEQVFAEQRATRGNVNLIPL